MSKAATVFDVTADIHGARLVVGGVQLFPACRSDGEIDYNIRRLKDDLDAAAGRMKFANLQQNLLPDFPPPPQIARRR